MSEQGGLSGIWQDLNSFIQVSVETFEDESRQSEFPLLVTFNVANIDSSPQIVFDEVRLAVGIPPDMHLEERKNLTSGESFSYEHHCHYSDLDKIRYNVEILVSPKTLFQIRQEDRKITTSKRNLSVKAYIEVLKDINIHKWLIDTLKTLTIPGPNTTLAEIKAHQDH
jgi:hypothetical protein